MAPRRRGLVSRRRLQLQATLVVAQKDRRRGGDVVPGQRPLQGRYLHLVPLAAQGKQR